MSASFSSNSYTPDNLVVGGYLISRGVTILSGQGALTRGTMLGKITIGAASVANGGAGAAGANTGNGTLTMDATTPIKAGAKVGVYKVRFVAAVTNNGTFQIADPDGNIIGHVVMAAGAGAFDGPIKFAIADGSTDFAVGDGFNVTLAAGSGKYKLSLSAAVDGSQTPDCILAEAVDATSADAVGPAYFAGEFNDAAVTYGTGHTAASVREGLRARGIHLIAVQTTY